MLVVDFPKKFLNILAIKYKRLRMSCNKLLIFHIILIFIFIYLFIYQVTSYHKKKLQLPLGLSPKHRKYAIPLKPTHKLAESKRYLVTW